MSRIAGLSSQANIQQRSIDPGKHSFAVRAPKRDPGLLRDPNSLAPRPNLAEVKRAIAEGERALVPLIGPLPSSGGAALSWDERREVSRKFHYILRRFHPAGSGPAQYEEAAQKALQHISTLRAQGRHKEAQQSFGKLIEDFYQGGFEGRRLDWDEYKKVGKAFREEILRSYPKGSEQVREVEIDEKMLKAVYALRSGGYEKEGNSLNAARFALGALRLQEALLSQPEARRRSPFLPEE
jgi:hypothetical protein